MIAKIRTGRSLAGAIRYNEVKVTAGEARAIGSINSLVDGHREGARAKTRALEALAARNSRTERNTYHVILSFAQGDEIDDERAYAIAKDYLAGIGFEKQPAFLYRHEDTVNDHIHIVTMNIRADGKRIKDSFIGATKSEKTREALEVKYGLTAARKEKRAEKLTVTERIGKRSGEPNGRALVSEIRATVEATLAEARPTTIGEFNALLKSRGIRAKEHVGEHGDGSAYRGYTFARLDPDTGKEIGARVKASRVFEAGWASGLAERFEKASAGKSKSWKKVVGRVEGGFVAAAKSGDGQDDLRSELRERGIGTIEHRSEGGRLYGVHYVDERTGHVFKASEVGRKFAARGWERIDPEVAAAMDRAEMGEKLMKHYMAALSEVNGSRSAAVRGLEEPELKATLVEGGIDPKGAQLAAADFVAAQRKGYDRLVASETIVANEVSAGVRKLQDVGHGEILARAGYVVEATTDRFDVNYVVRSLANRDVGFEAEIEAPDHDGGDGEYEDDELELISMWQEPSVVPWDDLILHDPPAGVLPKAVAEVELRGDGSASNEMSPPIYSSDQVRFEPSDVTVLAHLGRGNGFASLPPYVTLGNVDLGYWRDRMKAEDYEGLARALHERYVASVVDRAEKSSRPLGYALQRGVVLQPRGVGVALGLGRYVAHVAGAPEYGLALGVMARDRLRASGYGRADYAAVAGYMTEGKTELAWRYIAKQYGVAEAGKRNGMVPGARDVVAAMAERMRFVGVRALERRLADEGQGEEEEPHLTKGKIPRLGG